MYMIYSISVISHSKKDQHQQPTTKRQAILKAKKTKFEKRNHSKKEEIRKIDQKLNPVQIHQHLRVGFHRVKLTGTDI